MKIITRTKRASTVTKRWNETYFGNGDWYKGGLDKQKIHKELVALGVDPKADDVDKIIGNTSWTQCKCDECNSYEEETIVIGQEPDYDSATAEVCKKCISIALSKFN